MPIVLAPPDVREVKKPETKPKTEAKVDAKTASPPVKTDTKKGSIEKPKPAAVVSPPKPDTKPGDPKSK